MKMSKRIKSFNDKYPLIGPTFWFVSIQYFITQLVVAHSWIPPFIYSFSQNTISDLGNSACDIYADRFVCSPLFAWMNASFITLGITMIAGSTLIYQEFKKSTGSLIAFWFMAWAGLGTILVGLYPENTIGALHYLGAAMPFVLGNFALIIFAFVLEMPKIVKIYTFMSGLIALLGLVLFATHNYLSLGIGGMERVVAYPQTIWLVVFGIYMSSDHFMKRAKRTAKSLSKSVNLW